MNEGSIGLASLGEHRTMGTWMIVIFEPAQRGAIILSKCVHQNLMESKSRSVSHTHTLPVLLEVLYAREELVTINLESGLILD
jgi:hypothetical protein